MSEPAANVHVPKDNVKVFTSDEIASHNDRESCWIIVHGGSKIILKYAGKDATYQAYRVPRHAYSKEYDPIHPPDAITTHLPPSKHLGAIDPSSSTSTVLSQAEVEEQQRREELLAARPPLSEILNLYDFESVARRVLAPRAWAYYSSAADDEITLRENRGVYQRIWFRPQILVNVEKIDFSTTILGQRSSMPVYITATALGKLGHPDGELNLTRGAAKHGVIQMIPTLASCSFDQLVDAAEPGQAQFLQLYVNNDRAITERIVRHAEARGIKALFITDMRMKFDDEGANVQQGDDTVDKSQGAARAISSFIDPSLSWKDIPWFKSITKMHIILKGVQRWEDALRAYDAGLAGVVLSNHGGRQLDTAPAGVEVLVQVLPMPLREDGTRRFELFVDGGVRRATDVLKAVALGASAVGVGRPFLYAYSAYGQEGVEKALTILRDEFEMNMRLLGAPTIADVGTDLVDASCVGQHVVAVPSDRLYDTNYEGMQVAQMREAKARSSLL
ncbi:FMN-dependent dehydrogenase-domain-containing protein [Phellopilus nigrolimitatus]|nr:FMN-dependent dehydrogenase-domain-containing protein [Phellopilus nigrolimitatus]